MLRRASSLGDRLPALLRRDGSCSSHLWRRAHLSSSPRYATAVLAASLAPPEGAQAEERFSTMRDEESRGVSEATGLVSVFTSLPSQ
jgi:hypothetical protein